MSEASERTRLPVTVVLRRRMRQRGPWRFPSWSLLDVRPDDNAPGVMRHTVAEDVSDFVWGGLVLQLVRSDAETYWFNLTSQRPALFVICREDPRNGLMPVMVTLDQDEAMRQHEGEGEILSTAFPEWLAERVERFVMTHFKPQPRRRRRRQEEQDDPQQ